MFLFFKLEYQRTFFPCVKIHSHEPFGLQYEMVLHTKIWLELRGITGPCFPWVPNFLLFAIITSPIIHYVRPSPPPPPRGNIVFNFELLHTDSSLGLWDIKLQTIPGSIILTVLWHLGEVKNRGYIKFGNKQGVLWGICKLGIEHLIWRHGGHISVPNNENGAMLVVLKNPLWVEQFFM